MVPMATLELVKLRVTEWARFTTFVPVAVQVGLLCTVTIGFAMSAMPIICFYCRLATVGRMR